MMDGRKKLVKAVLRVGSLTAQCPMYQYVQSLTGWLLQHHLHLQTLHPFHPHLWWRVHLNQHPHLLSQKHLHRHRQLSKPLPLHHLLRKHLLLLLLKLPKLSLKNKLCLLNTFGRGPSSNILKNQVYQP